MHSPSDTLQVGEPCPTDLPIVRKTNPLTGQHSIHAAKPYEAGEVICKFSAAETLSFPTRHTLQTERQTHIILSPTVLQYTNHSCTPSAFFDTTSMILLCLRNISPGEEITFFYPSTEWEMSDPFVCGCGTEHCLGAITGASGMAPEILGRYALTDYISSMLSARKEIPIPG